MSRPIDRDVGDDDVRASDSAARASVNPYVFVVGCPRSGTTLLQRMLDNHPSLAVANDTHFIPRALEKTSPAAMDSALQGLPVRLRRELVDGVRSYHRFSRLGLDDAAVDRAVERSGTYARFVAALYDELAAGRGKPLAGEKTPDYVRRIPLLDALFPSARFIHIVRDGRDVALSLLDWATETKGPGRFELWRDEPVAVAALWWQWLVSAGRAAGAAVGPNRYLEIAYERLVEGPEDVLRVIAAFLDVPMAEEMLAFHEGKHRDQEDLSAKKAWLPPTSGLRDWRRHMPSDDVGLFETLAGDALVASGYECGPGDGAPPLADRARKCLSWWQTQSPQRSRGAHPTR